MVFGPTKGGKSTFLRDLTEIEFFFTGTEKETSNFWNILENREQSEIPIHTTEVFEDEKLKPR
jgi:hypothetical protein